MAEPHDFDRAAASARDERDAAIEAARTKLSGKTLTAFNELLAVNEVANFAWWNEDHNFYIDLRASIPLPPGALALGAACDADVFDDGLFLFFPEALDVSTGRVAWKHLQSLATARRQYYDHYNEIRATLPKVVGTLPDKVDDPALIEIFGSTTSSFKVCRRLPMPSFCAVSRRRQARSGDERG